MVKLSHIWLRAEIMGLNAKGKNQFFGNLYQGSRKEAQAWSFSHLL